MFEMILQSLVTVVAATLLFTVGMPLLGFVAGLMVRVVLPYLLIPVLALALLVKFYPLAQVALALPVMTALWVVLVLGTRQVLNKRCNLELTWFQGHYRAAASLLSLGSLVKLVLPLGSYFNRHIPEEELELIHD